MAAAPPGAMPLSPAHQITVTTDPTDPTASQAPKLDATPQNNNDEVDDDEVDE
jgi:hypothetical protein